MAIRFVNYTLENVGFVYWNHVLLFIMGPRRGVEIRPSELSEEESMMDKLA